MFTLDSKCAVFYNEFGILYQKTLEKEMINYEKDNT